jgi:predicted O-linked N-acetylglucosamine transferase (SPINDLY family)
MKQDHRRAEQHRLAGLKALQASQWTAAVAEFERAARLAPHDVLMPLNLARAHARAGDIAAAIEAARAACRLDPANPLACRVLAEYLGQQSRYSEAAEAFDAYPADAPRDFDFLNAQGNVLFQAGRLQDAVSVFFQALALKIDAALVHYRLGLAFKDMGLTREATECFRTAVSLDDGEVRALALSLLVFEGRQACDWSHVEDDTAQLLAALDASDDAGGQLLSPFALLAVDATPAQQRRIGALRVKGLSRAIRPLPAPGPRRPGPLRIGYLSADFYQHATAVLMAELLERRDTARFEVFLYSHSPDDGSEIGRRVRAACEHFVDVTHCSNAEIARRMRADDIDIAIDLKGHTRGSRFEVLAARPARVQATYLGYPATTGAEFIDYLIGDPIVTPLAHAAHYSERIAQLPHSYQPNDRQRPLLPAPDRAALGLPANAVVLCCFNQAYKFSPHMLDLWAQILARAPRAVLWMLAWNPHAQANLTRELAARGVGPQRVFWAPKQNLAEHIARLRAADLFLDTWPCNAHTTASEALWAGVPVLTVPGPTFASRVAASLVHACGLPDLAAPDEARYVELAAALANEPATLAGLKAHLESQRLTLPLFDTDRYVRDYEALLQRMAERAAAGLPPEHLPADDRPSKAAFRASFRHFDRAPGL